MHSKMDIMKQAQQEWRWARKDRQFFADRVARGDLSARAAFAQADMAANKAWDVYMAARAEAAA
jgi:hypothetical protein